MTRLIIPALVALLVSGPVWAEDVAICTGTLKWQSGRTNDYEFRLVFSRWTGKLIIKGWTESFQFLNDNSADVHAITGRVVVSSKDEKGVQIKQWSSGIKGFAAGSAKYFTALLFGGDDGNDGGSIIYTYTLVYNGDKPDKPLVLGTLDQISKPLQDGVGTCR